MRPAALRPSPARQFDLTAISTRRLLLGAAVVCGGLWAILLTATGL